MVNEGGRKIPEIQLETVEDYKIRLEIVHLKKRLSPLRLQYSSRKPRVDAVTGKGDQVEVCGCEKER